MEFKTNLESLAKLQHKVEQSINKIQQHPKNYKKRKLKSTKESTKLQEKQKFWVIRATQQERVVTKQAKTTQNSHLYQTTYFIQARRMGWMFKVETTPRPTNSTFSIMVDSA